MLSLFRIGLVCSAAIAACCCFSSDASAQGFRIGNVIQAGNGQGFRVGNVMQAGGGQGFRLGLGGAGMHFGGGQGATFGGQNFGMRFGNGQGARFGGANYGMQFGGGQGAQFGQLQTVPQVQPGTYYYGDVRGSGQFQAQPSVVQPGSYSAFTTTPTDTVPTVPSQSGAMNGYIRLGHSADATETIKYQLNGTDFNMAPGDSILMEAGEQWKLAFSPGEGLDNRKAELSESGNFEFSKSPSEEGWILTEQEDSNAAENGSDKSTPAVQESNPAETPPKERSVLNTEQTETNDDKK